MGAVEVSQEVIPAMDQTLKGLMVMLAEEDNEGEDILIAVEQALYCTKSGRWATWATRLPNCAI
jgi:hypothetical protein